jgi:uncharacterized membrane protein
LLLLVVIVYIISGFGITQYKIVDTLTFGIFSKSASFKIHNSLEVAFLILLVLHIYFSLSKRSRA